MCGHESASHAHTSTYNSCLKANAKFVFNDTIQIVVWSIVLCVKHLLRAQ